MLSARRSRRTTPCASRREDSVRGWSGSSRRSPDPPVAPAPRGLCGAPAAVPRGLRRRRNQGHRGMTYPRARATRQYVVARLERALGVAINERVKPYGDDAPVHDAEHPRNAAANCRTRSSRRRIRDPSVDERGHRGTRAKASGRAGPASRSCRVFPAALTTKGGRCSRRATKAVDALERETFAWT